MSIFRPRERRDNSGAFPYPVLPPFPGMNVWGGTTAGVDQAMQTAAVWSCVRLQASTVSMMPVKTFTLRDGVRYPTQPPPFFRRPSARDTMPEWLYQVMVSLMLRGNAYGRKVAFDADGYPTQIELLHPDDVTVRQDNDGAVRYFTKSAEIPTDQVWHQRAFLMTGRVQGLSPIEYHAASIGLDLAVGKFAGDFFKDGAHPTGVITSDKLITQEQARSIKDHVMAALRGSREPLVLGAGVQWKQLQVSPEESQFLKTREYGVNDIARVFGVPAPMVGGTEGNSMTYSNREQRSLDYLTYSVQWWLTLLEGAFEAMMPGKQHARFDTSVLLRTDLETYMKSMAIGVAAKVTTPDEVRAGAPLDLPPLTEAQKAVLDLIPLDVRPTGTPASAPLKNPQALPLTSPAPSPSKENAA